MDNSSSYRYFSGPLHFESVRVSVVAQAGHPMLYELTDSLEVWGASGKAIGLSGLGLFLLVALASFYLRRL